MKMRGIFLICWVLLASAASSAIEISYYQGDRRFSIKLTSEELSKLVKIDPLDDSTYALTVARAGKLATPEIEKFRKKYDLPATDLQGVGISKFYQFPDGREVWLWKVTCKFGKDPATMAGQPLRPFSFFVTEGEKVISPKEVPYSGKKK